mgnify:CR=1 FL=1
MNNGTDIKRVLCNYLIQNGLVQPYQVIRHSYSSHRLTEDWGGRDSYINICPTLDTRCDCLGVVVYEERK